MSVPVGLPGEQRNRSLASGYFLKALESCMGMARIELKDSFMG